MRPSLDKILSYLASFSTRFSPHLGIGRYLEDQLIYEVVLGQSIIL